MTEARPRAASAMAAEPHPSVVRRRASALLTSCCVAAALALAAPAAFARADATPVASPALAERLERLDDDDPAAREAATRALMGDERFTLGELRDALADATTFETAHRLRAVLRHRTIAQLWADFPDGDEGAMGLRHLPVPPHSVPGQDAAGVRIVLTLPGFPAHTHLRAGDVVTAVEGDGLEVRLGGDRLQLKASATKFTDAIKARPGRRPITVTVVRDGEPIEVTMPTAPLQALDLLLTDEPPLRLRGNFGRKLAIVEAADRLRGPSPEPVAVPVDAEPIVLER